MRADTDGVRAVLAVLALAFLPACLASAATQPKLTAAQFVADLNLKRVTNGLPPVIENPAWSAACAAHVDYLHLNPAVLDSDWPGPHEETPGKPGYSAAGVFGGGHGDLAWGFDSTADVWAGKVWDDPWEDAPGHLSQLLDPFADEIGFAFAHGIMCAMVGDSYIDGYVQHGASHDANLVYTYPGDGTKGIYTSESAGESPATPAELAGIKSDVTGPYLFVKIDGPWLTERGGGMHDAQASLTGPAGPVAIRTLVPSDMPSGMSFMVGYGDAILLPLKPLQPATTYTATISATWGTTPFTHTWSFTTGGTAPVPEARQQATPAHVEATLPKRNLTVRQTRSVSLKYWFTSQSDFFSHELDRATGSSWLPVDDEHQIGRSLKGPYRMTVARLFGRHPVTPGRYRLLLRGDADIDHAKTLFFTVRV